MFSDAEALQDLNRIAHGAVKAEVLARLTAHPPPLAAIDAIALFEGGLAELCQYTVAVTAPGEDRITRLMSREGISRTTPKPGSGPSTTAATFNAFATSPWKTMAPRMHSTKPPGR